MTTTPGEAPTTGAAPTEVSILAAAVAAALKNATEEEIMETAGEPAMDAYDEQVADAEHEAVRQIINWWRNLRPEATAELVTRIREELPALVDPERFDANRDPFESLETILRDRRPEGGRDAYTRILRRLAVARDRRAPVRRQRIRRIDP